MHLLHPSLPGSRQVGDSPMGCRQLLPPMPSSSMLTATTDAQIFAHDGHLAFNAVMRRLSLFPLIEPLLSVSYQRYLALINSPTLIRIKISWPSLRFGCSCNTSFRACSCSSANTSGGRDTFTSSIRRRSASAYARALDSLTACWLPFLTEDRRMPQNPTRGVALEAPRFHQLVDCQPNQ